MAVVVHFDLDYFFAQVEEVREPGLAERPVGVQQHMEVASVNYVARTFGLYNRISVADARRLCPTLVLVRGDNEVNGMQRYRLASQQVLRCIMNSWDECVGSSSSDPTLWEGRRVEHASFDDFYVLFDERLARAWGERRASTLGSEVRASHTVLEAAAEWAEHVRTAILYRTRLRCSAGIASSKLLSLLATKRAKPNGVHVCARTREAEHALLDSARIDALRGAGIVGLSPTIRRALSQVRRTPCLTLA